MSAVELLAPAGSPECLDAAIGEGADAVYLGLKTFNARMRASNFAYAQFEGAARALRRMGRKVYVAVNTVFEQRESDRVYQLLKYLDGAGADGIIAQDLGVLALAREHFPALPVHASTQMNVSSGAGAAFAAGLGARRVVLARELSLREIEAARAACTVELEVFVHGALCVSVSGLCLFSSFLGGKSANRGACAQACRRSYRSGGGEDGYYFSPPDLQLLDHVRDLCRAGVDALKIEGRMKSAEYVATVTAAYRRVLDAADGPEAAYEKALEEGRALLRGDFAREKTAYFFVEGARAAAAGFAPERAGGVGVFLGSIERTRGSGETREAALPAGDAALALEAGDSIRLHGADDTRRVAHKLRGARREGAYVWVSAPDGFEPGDSAYLIQKKAANRFYAPVVPPSPAACKRRPGFDKAPAARLVLPPLKPFRRGGRGPNDAPLMTNGLLREGIYAAVSGPEDLYAVQSRRPCGVIVPFNRKTAAALLAAGADAPFKPREILLGLDPVTADGADGELERALPGLLDKGYGIYIANNLSQLAVLSRAKTRSGGPPVIIAGPSLYTFNRHAAACAARAGASFFVTPLENSRQNLEKTFAGAERARVFVTAYAHPALFRLRANLAELYPFREFVDKQGAAFRLRSLSAGPQGTNSVVVPERPFSITDKLAFLREAGFRRVILDFSTRPLNKARYKDVFKAAETGEGGASRFNWKNGFYKEETPAAT